MPAATFTATVSELYTNECKVTSIDWHATLESRMVGGSRSHPPTGQEPYRHTFAVNTPVDNSDPQPTLESTWTIPWGNLISGGALTVRATVNLSINNRMTQSVTVGREVKIGGRYEQMTAQVKQVTGESLEKLAVAWQESHHYQFDIEGNPRLGGGDGWGIMQLDNIPNVTLMEPHFWDWRANVREGVKYLDETYVSARKWLIDIRKIVNTDNNPSNNWPEDSWDPEEDKGSNGSTVRGYIWDDVFSRYNTGSHLYSPNGNGGEVNCAPRRPAPEGEKPRVIDGNSNQSFDGCDYKIAIRCHMTNKTWEYPANKVLDSKCRESTVKQPETN